MANLVLRLKHTVDKYHVVILEKREAWLCQSVGYLRDEPLNDAAFSSDGSLLAVAYGQVQIEYI